MAYHSCKAFHRYNQNVYRHQSKWKNSRIDLFNHTARLTAKHHKYDHLVRQNILAIMIL